jgi:hypothetical protein
MSLQKWTYLILILILGIVTLTYSGLPPGDQMERVRAFSRDLEFDYIAWTLDAFGVKLEQLALQASDFLPAEARHKLVLDYLNLVDQINQAERLLNEIYANPEISDPEKAAFAVRGVLDTLTARRSRLAPLAESVLQDQIGETVAELGLTLGGQPIPPVLYHSTPLPTALIVSPRDEIRQDANISLQSELSADERTALEDQIDSALDVSSLIVNIGGIGVYPTMVMQTSNLNFLAEVVAHEWVHNFLTLRPLGINYLTSPELRTMNETAASIAGNEIGALVIEQFYPELVPPPPATPSPSTPEEPSEPPAFDFNEEMRITRVTVDEMLAEGKIEEAEAYMEARRVFFWENGYLIRKINQAYFAFYGAYADQPGGEAGEDPVGAAVRELRAQSPSLADFLKRIAWMTSFEQLQEAVEAGNPES